MPRQALDWAPRAIRLASGMAWRRLILGLASGGIGLFTGTGLVLALGLHGAGLLGWLTIALSVLLSVWVGFGFASACAGFAAALAEPRLASRPTGDAVGRTAILIATYNEDPGLVLSATQAMAEDLRRLGQAERYDVFILSDTRDGAVARAEAVGLVRLRQRLVGGPAVYYRRRVQNIDRKAGNIGDWVETHGGAYDYMLVLDADSLMAGETILALTAQMDRDPGLGLLQTAPVVVGAETPFARLQQFASRLYGPVYARGIEWWSGSEGNYWGHNAIIRTAAFAESAGLPHLTGRRPWGGHIMSHDFIEAALLRRGGWAVRTVAALSGSYEESPPTLLDLAIRDRRWCQGNLQHARLLFAPGLHWISRLHLAMGIFAYLAPPAWLALLVCGAFVWPRQRLQSGSAQAPEAAAVLGLNLFLLLAPKAMGLGLALGKQSLRTGFGGGGRLVAGVLVECLASLLITPVLMVMQSAAVAEVLLGRDSGWRPQRREGAALSRRTVWRAHRNHVCLGVVGLFAAPLVSSSLLVWAGPVFLSLALSAMLSLHTSKPGPPGGLFRAPEDEDPPLVLARSQALRRDYAAETTDRRQIEALFRSSARVYEPRARALASAKQLGDPRLRQGFTAAPKIGSEINRHARPHLEVKHQPPPVGHPRHGIAGRIDRLAEA
jgi:membrane glycosyltransferase